MKFLIVLCLFGLVAAEKPAPYPAKGWKPQGARLELPREYGPPKNPENVDFTTVTEDYITTTDYPFNNDEDDTLRVQALPAVDANSQFRKFAQNRPAKLKKRPQAARIQMAPAPAFANQPFLLSPIFSPKSAPVSTRLQERQFGQLEQDVNNPKNDVQQVVPARAYGVPPTTTFTPITEERSEPEVPQDSEPEQPEDIADDDGEQEEESEEAVVAVSNVVTNEQLQQGQVGQYYILLPDNSLQKVRFATKQTMEDREINGFSAQLRYSPVEAIKDPVFGYDEQGKLVRLYK